MDVHQERQHSYSAVNVFPGSVGAQLRCGGKLFTFESWHIWDTCTKNYKFWFVFLQVIEAYLGDILFEAWHTEQHTVIHVLVYVSVQNSVRQGAIKSSIEHPFILCQLLQLYFYRPDAILDAQPTVSKC